MNSRLSQFGRTRTTSIEGGNRPNTPERTVHRSSFKSKKDVNFDPKEYMVAECSVGEI